jgi:hypothetical protein
VGMIEVRGARCGDGIGLGRRNERIGEEPFGRLRVDILRRMSSARANPSAKLGASPSDWLRVNMRDFLRL